MTQRIRYQAQQVWQALSGSDTRQAYGAAAASTWTILREGGVLLWLLTCLVLVAFDAGVATAIAAGRASRRVIGRLGEARPDAIASSTKQTLLTAGKTGLAHTLTQAREQLKPLQKPEVAAAQPAATQPAAAVKSDTVAAAPAEAPASEAAPGPAVPPMADGAAAK